MTNNITLSKGSTSVSVDTIEVADNFKNTVISLKLAQTKQNQDSGPKETKIIDLQRVEHTLVIRGVICPTDSKTAEEIKDDLVYIWKGAGQTGGTVSLNYEGNCGAFTSTTNTNPISGVITDLLFKETPSSGASSLTTVDFKYDVQITFMEGSE